MQTEYVSPAQGHAKGELTRQEAKGSMVTQEEQQKSTAQVRESVGKTTVSHTLHKFSLHGRVPKKVLRKVKTNRNSHLKVRFFIFFGNIV